MKLLGFNITEEIEVDTPFDPPENALTLEKLRKAHDMLNASNGNPAPAWAYLSRYMVFLLIAPWWVRWGAKIKLIDSDKWLDKRWDAEQGIKQ